MIITELTALLLFLIGRMIGLSSWQMVVITLAAIGLTIAALMQRRQHLGKPATCYNDR